MEDVARNEYMAGDTRDPTACSLFYFALGKVKLVHGLWKQAAWHKEQKVMLKFLANDFRESRWKTAALKNAFALLGKQRTGTLSRLDTITAFLLNASLGYAAAFFLLGGSLRDAINVCVKHLNDFQLALAICRVVESGDDGTVFLDVVRETVVPLAFKDGNRWLASWAFWKLKRRDLAVKVLIVSI
jgi:hypothetical protein